MRATMAARTVVFITSNKNKVAEVEAMLDSSVKLCNQSLDLVEIQGTIEEVTQDKCRRAADIVTLGLLHFNGCG